MMNIQTQCCGMLLLWIITYFFAGLKRVEVRTQKSFWYMLVVANVCVIADVLSVCAICYADHIPYALVVFICKFYLLALLGLGYCGLIYLCSDIYINDKKRQIMLLPLRIGVVISGLLIMILPLHYVCEESGGLVYSDGPSPSAAYISAGVFFLVMLVHIIKEYKRINPRRRVAVLLWISIWIIAAAIEFATKRLLIISYAGIVGVLIIYMMIENPEANLDKVTGFFNMSAMMQYLSEGFANRRVFSIINIAAEGEVRDICGQMSEAVIFAGGGELFLVFHGMDARDNAEAAMKALETATRDEMLFFIPDSLIAPDTEKLMGLLRAAQKLPRKEQKSRIFTLDGEFIRLLEQRRQTERLLQEAIRDDRVEVFYQPIYSTKEKRFHSAEALVRIRDTEGKIIPPGVFIPVAESNGMIIELGKIVFDKVCHFISRHEDSDIGLEYVEVNLSVIQGEDENLASDMLRIIEKHGVSSRCVNLEITESASLRGKEQLLENMKVLMKEGIDFSLDDFGTGNSNLDYMADMPVKIVKFDRNMTQGYFSSDKVKHIMNAAIQMIHGMGMAIVAEGIETKEQLEHMVEEGIEYIQGFYFSRPLPEADFEEFLRRNNGVGV